jgi:hypothetical protein
MNRILAVLLGAFLAGQAPLHAGPPRGRSDSFTVDLVYRWATRNVYKDVGSGELRRLVLGDTGKFEIQLVGQVEDPEIDKTHPIEARGRYMIDRHTTHVVKESVAVPPFSGIDNDELASYRERLRKALPGIHLATVGGPGTSSYMALGALLQLDAKDVREHREVTVTEAGDTLIKLFFDLEAAGGLRLTRFDFPLPRRKINLVFRFP